jgi:hypothetical protein
LRRILAILVATLIPGLPATAGAFHRHHRHVCHRCHRPRHKHKPPKEQSTEAEPVTGGSSKAEAPGQTEPSGLPPGEATPREIAPLHEALPATFSPGIDQGTEAADFQADAILHPHLARVEFGLGEANLVENVARVAASLAKTGTTLQPLFSFYGRIPSAAEAKALGAVAKAVPSIRHLEFGNETSYGYQYGDGYASGSYKERARRYAVLVREAAEAVAPYGDGILCQAEDGGSGSSAWVDEMFAAVPNLTQYVAGWTIHPYTNGGTAKLERMVSDLARHGDTRTPVDVTEWGVPSDNGRTLSDGTHYTTSEAAALVAQSTIALRAAALEHPLGSFIVYQIRDQQPSGATTNREAYFGVLTHSGAAKGALTTAIEGLLAE